MSQGIHTNYVKGKFYRGLVNNSTEGDFVVPVPQADEPVSVDESGDPSANALVINCGGSKTLIYPFGTDADNKVFNFRVYLWQKCARTSSTTSDEWLPFFVGGFVATMSSALNGVAGGTTSTTEYLADTITEEATNTWDDTLVEVRSFAGDQLAEVRVNTEGYEKLEIRFDLTTGASANALYRIL